VYVQGHVVKVNRYLIASAAVVLMMVPMALALSVHGPTYLADGPSMPPIKAEARISFVPDSWQPGPSPDYVAHFPGLALSFAQEGIALQLLLAADRCAAAAPGARVQSRRCGTCR